MKYYTLRIAVVQKALLATIVLSLTTGYFFFSWLFFKPSLVMPQTKTNSKRCSEPWPRMDLLLPVPPLADGLKELNNFIFPSLQLFWPQQHMSLLLMTDGEVPEIDKFTAKLQAVINETFPKIFYSSILLNTPPFRFKRGWDRQQWLMFWADNFTNADYVGFLDTDAVFVTRVDQYDLYKDGKPIVRGLYGKPQHPTWWPRATKSTYEFTGLKEPFGCMTYFPVVISVKHLAMIREHIRRHLEKPIFDDAFVAIMNDGIYSQFNIMCTYLWYFERDSYYWTIGERDHSWTGPPADGQISSLEEANITQELFLRQQPHLAVHWSYETFKDEPDAMKRVLRSGICYSLTSFPVNESPPMTIPNTPSFCDDFPDRVNKINPFEWTFESYDISPFDKNLALKAHQQRLVAIGDCPLKLEKKLLENPLLSFGNNSNFQTSTTSYFAAIINLCTICIFIKAHTAI